jgi:hypothetical protein
MLHERSATFLLFVRFHVLGGCVFLNSEPDVLSRIHLGQIDTQLKNPYGSKFWRAQAHLPLLMECAVWVGILIHYLAADIDGEIFSHVLTDRSTRSQVRVISVSENWPAAAVRRRLRQS